jgi:hypothetical protein
VIPALLLCCSCSCSPLLTEGELISPQPRQWEVVVGKSNLILGLNDWTRSLPKWEERLKPWIGKKVIVVHKVGFFGFGNRLSLLVNEVVLEGKP